MLHVGLCAPFPFLVIYLCNSQIRSALVCGILMAQRIPFFVFVFPFGFMNSCQSLQESKEQLGIVGCCRVVEEEEGSPRWEKKEGVCRCYTFRGLQHFCLIVHGMKVEYHV